jgi:hypothetical protein
LEETKIEETNPFRRLEKEQDRQKRLDALRKLARSGAMSSDDFMELLRDFEFRQKNKDIIIKFLKAVGCYHDKSDKVFYLKLLRQLPRRVNHFSKASHTFQYVKPIVNLNIISNSIEKF